MNDTELSPLDEDLRAMMRQAANAAPAVPAGARARVLARVEAAIGPGGGPPDGAPGVSTPPSPPAASGLARILPIAAALLVGGVAGALVMRSTMPAPASVERLVYVDRVAPPLPSPPATQAVATAAPSPEAPTTAALPRAAVTAASSTTDRPGQLGEEGRLLDVARRSLEAQDGRAALDAVTRHERRYPSGILAQEREAMAVRALLQLGRTDDARARAERFRASYPDSMLLAAVEAAVARGDGTP